MITQLMSKISLLISSFDVAATASSTIDKNNYESPIVLQRLQAILELPPFLVALLALVLQLLPNS